MSSTSETDENEWGAHLSPVGAFIREQRRMVRLSQRQLARTTGLSDTYLSQLERGLHEPSLRALRAIAKGLNISAEQLIGLTGAIEADLTAPANAAATSSSADTGQAGEKGEKGQEGEEGQEGGSRQTNQRGTEAAIRADDRLSESQKAALLSVLASFVGQLSGPA